MFTAHDFSDKLEFLSSSGFPVPTTVTKYPSEENMIFSMPYMNNYVFGEGHSAPLGVPMHTGQQSYEYMPPYFSSPLANYHTDAVPLHPNAPPQAPPSKQLLQHYEPEVEEHHDELALSDEEAHADDHDPLDAPVPNVSLNGAKQGAIASTMNEAHKETMEHEQLHSPINHKTSPPGFQHSLMPLPATLLSYQPDEREEDEATVDPICFEPQHVKDLVVTASRSLPWNLQVDEGLIYYIPSHPQFTHPR